MTYNGSGRAISESRFQPIDPVKPELLIGRGEPLVELADKKTFSQFPRATPRIVFPLRLAPNT